MKKPEDPQVYCSHTEMRDPASLVEHPRNYNTHPAEQIRLLAKIIKHQGWRNPITVSKRSGYVVKGHGRLAAALQLGCSEVPVDVQEYKDEASEYADMIADNRIAELAEADQDALKGLLTDDVFEGFDLDLTGFGDLDFLNDEIDNTDLNDDSENAEDLIDQGDILQQKWGTKLGQIWQLGVHRLMCGDSTKGDLVNILLDGSVPMLMVTDPPYGVKYDANWRNEAERKGGKKIGGSAVGKVENDDRFDWAETWRLFEGDIAYVWHAGAFAPQVGQTLIDTGLEIKSQIIWAKSNFAIGRGAYHWKHEPCWYAVRKGSKSNWIGDRSQTTLWEIPKPHKSETGHSTQKPVECMARPIRHHQSESVYEPFCGSGTTLIACEQLNRKCYAMEISPKYVAVILQRWHDMTNQDPVLIETIDS
jgi:DNA modification methylase